MRSLTIPCPSYRRHAYKLTNNAAGWHFRCVRCGALKPRR